MARLHFWQRRKAAQAVDDARSPSYKPVFLKLPFLLFFATYICLLLAILEWGCRVFPSADGFQDVPDEIPPDARIVLYSAPLAGRQVHQTPAPAAGPLLPRVPAPTKTPRRAPKPHIGLFQKRNATLGADETAETTESKGLSETLARSESTQSESARSESSAPLPRSDSVSEVAESSAVSSRSEAAPGKQESTPETENTGEPNVQTSSAKTGEEDALDDTTTPTDAPTSQMTFTTVTATPTVVSGVTVMVRPPVTIAGREAYPPEYVDLVRLQHNNSTLGLNASSSNYTSHLMKRRPDYSKYAHLSGPTVGVSYYLNTDQPRMRAAMYDDALRVGLIKGATLAYYMPSTAENDRANGKPCELEEEGMEDQRWGLVTCNGPAFVFHDTRCYERWVSAAQREVAVRAEREAAGLPWILLEKLDQQWEPQWPEDVIRPCPGSPIGLADAPPLLGGGYNAPPPVPTERITFRGSDGQPTSVGNADLYYAVDPRNGQVTATSTVLWGPHEERLGLTPVTLFDSRGLPTGTVQGRVLIITNSRGQPVATTTKIFEASTTQITLRNDKGEATRTVAYLLPPPSPVYTAADPVVVTVTNARGQPIATVTGRPTAPRPNGSPFLTAGGNGKDGLYIISSSAYWLVLYMPVVLTLFCAVFSEMISNNLRELLPFNAMTRADGATAEESLLMPKGVISGVVNSFQLLFRFKQPVSLLSDLMVAFSAIITTLSTEAVGIRLYGNCLPDDATGCYMGLAVFLPPTRAVQALLIASLIAVLAIAFIMWRWDSGVASPPGSLMATGSLMQNGRVRELFQGIRTEGGASKNISDRNIMAKLQGHRFSLQHYRTPSQRVLSYGIVAKGPRADSREGLLNKEKSKTWIKKTLTKASTFSKMTKRPSWATTPAILDWSTYRRRTTDKVLDVGGFLYLVGLIILVVYYNVTINPDTSFEAFINDQDSGVRVLFTAFGVLLSFFWDYYYARVALMEPYRQLSRRPQPPLKSVAVAPPTTVFVGIWESVMRREVFASCVAFANILSKLTPPLLSNIPFSPVQTWMFHEVSTWTAIACLAFLTLVLAYGTLLVKYPHVPIDPSSVAGRMYYLCDSDAMLDFQGMSRMTEKECLSRLDPEWKYTFGKMVGVSGETRIGVQAYTAAPAKEASAWDNRESSEREGNRPSDDAKREEVKKLAFGQTGGHGLTDARGLGNQEKQAIVWQDQAGRL